MSCQVHTTKISRPTVTVSRFIDTGNTNPVTGKLYLVAIGEGILEVRRLLLIGADLVLNHINPIYPNVPFNADTMTVIGRVAAVMTNV